MGGVGEDGGVRLTAGLACKMILLHSLHSFVRLPVPPSRRYVRARRTLPHTTASAMYLEK